MSFGNQQTPLFNLGQFERQQDEDNLLQQFSTCPACRGDFVVALTLPCSHPMCGHCVAAAAAAEGRRPHPRPKSGLNSCTVLCPCCRGPVELPCWTWSSASSCLPEYPNLSLGRSAAERADASHQNEQRDFSNRDSADVTIWGFSSSSVAPADGSVDLQDEEMKQSVYGLHFSLDPSHVPSHVCLSNSSLTATYQAESSPTAAGSVQPLALLSGDVVVGRGQFYWEVDVCDSALYRIGVRSLDSSRAWWFERKGFYFSAVYDGTVEPIYSVPPWIKTIGLFLNIGGGVLSFHNALSQEHLVTLPTRFDPNGVVPAFGLGQGRLKLRTGLPPPPLVFHSKDSGYRGAQGTDVGRWRRGIAFGSVKKVVEKFEELALSH